jgi:NCS2 family nucleobase:cation symporter-2/xanthine permease XanP
MTSIVNKPDQILYAENETPPLGITILLAVTHVALIFDAVVFIPNVLGKITGATPEQIRFSCFVTILVSALCTLIQVVKFKHLGTGFILFMGSYSAFLSCSIDAAKIGGLALVATMTVLSVPVVFLFAYFFRFFRHIVTPAVGGIVIILVAVNLIPIGLELWHGGNAQSTGFGSPANYMVGAITMGTLLALMIFGNRNIRLWTPLIGLGAGYLSASFFGLLDLHHFHASPLFGFPTVAWPGLVMDFQLSYLPLLAAFLMATLAGSIEGTGNIMLVQTVSRRDKKISYDRIQSGLYCDGLGKLLSGLGGGAPISTYCDNIPLIEMTGVASRAVGICGAILLGLLAFIPKAGAIILDMPSPVIGGMLIAIAAMLFYSGIGLVMESGLNNQTGLMLGVSITVGMIAEAEIFFPDLMPISLSPLLQNGVAMGGFTAFILSALIRLAPRQKASFSIDAVPKALPDLVLALGGVVAQLKLSESEIKRMELACEETFMHLISEIKEKDNTVLFKISRVEQGLFTEAIIGHCVSDIVNLTPPSNLMTANDESIQNLGMFLLSKIVRDIRHIQISGVTYISFIA